MLQYNGTIDPGFTEEWCRAPLPQYVVIEILRTFGIFLPPCTDGAHIMRGWGDHRQIRGISRDKELLHRVFWHALDLEAENTKLRHHIRHRMRHHTKILSTDQHIRCFLEIRQLLHCFFLPEIVLAAIEVVNVKLTKFILNMRDQEPE